MFKQTVALKHDEHADLKILETNNYAYAREILLAPIVVSEIADVAREFPIVFPINEAKLPCALMGLETGRNAYVDAQGQWQANYIPAHIRRYPFILAHMENLDDGDTRYMIAFDPDAPQLNASNGHAVFAPDGALSGHMQRRMKLLEEIQRAMPVTRRMVEALDAAGLLVERVITLSRDGKPVHQIKGMRAVDEARLNAMSHEDFAQLRDQGALPLIYAHLLSWANLRQGPLAGKYTRSPDASAPSAAEGSDFLFNDDRVF